MSKIADDLFEGDLDLFFMDASSVTKLSSIKAMEICTEAAGRGFVVRSVEGGILDQSGFELRRDCIWDWEKEPSTDADVFANNAQAFGFIEEKERSNNVFILTLLEKEKWVGGV